MQTLCGFLLLDKWSLTHSNVVLQYYSLYYDYLNSKTFERIQFRTLNPKKKTNEKEKTEIETEKIYGIILDLLMEAFKKLIIISFIG